MPESSDGLRIVHVLILGFRSEGPVKVTCTTFRVLDQV